MIYLECAMGAAGDMLCAALYELLDDKKAFLDKANSMGLPGVTVSAEPVSNHGISGMRFHVSVNGVEEHEHRHDHSHHEEHGHHHHDGHGHREEHHHHAAPGDIYALIRSLDVPERVRSNAEAVYRLIADAEARAHGVPVEQIHFHEVGALDAVADVVCFCLLMDMLGIDGVTASPVTTGFGSVNTAHGVLPVPAPATAYLLSGIPTHAGDIECELCTPTGAALLRRFCTSFGQRPDMAANLIGYGMGTKEFTDRPNCVRAFLGNGQTESDKLCELRCTVDDMTPEAASFAAETILSEGARDVYIQQVLMKKGRPGLVFVCLCGADEADRFTQLLLKHTTTLGVRIFQCSRVSLEREVSKLDTPYGTVRVKTSYGPGIVRSKAEYDDVAAIAKNRGISFSEAEKLLSIS